MRPYAEVIGDPVAQSRSPAIHGAWLAAEGIGADYRATRVVPADVPAFLAERRGDAAWRGCNVTAPLKQAAVPLLDRLDAAAAAIGAVNCIVPAGDMLVGYNSDVDGVLAALGGLDLMDRPVAMIGAGGAARAGLAGLGQLGARVRIVARNPTKASTLSGADLYPLDAASAAFAGVHAVINASTLGMADADPMPESLLNALDRVDPGATVFDMVYHPEATALLRAARERSLHVVGGLVMLEAQARRAFDLFFDALRPRR